MTEDYNPEDINRSETPEQESKRQRRTKAEMLAARKAEKDAIRLELLSELREQGRLKDDTELRDTPTQETLELLPFNVIIRNIQAEVKVGKGNTNIGNSGQPYHYRTAEEILATAKGVCAKWGCHIDTTARVEYHSDLYCYMVVDATLTRDETGESITRSAAAREDPTPRGMMAAAQGSGACITYAKKYALDNLLALESPDADPDAKRRPVEKKNAEEDTASGEESVSGDTPRKPALRRNTHDWRSYVAWIVNNPDKSDDWLKAKASEKARFNDDTWHDLLKDAGRL